MIPSAWIIARKWQYALSLPLLGVAVWWVTRHITNIVHADPTAHRDLSLLWIFVFASLAWHLTLAWTEKTYKTTLEQTSALDKLWVAVNVPVFNEDPEALKRALIALLQQTRLPQVIEVVQNGALDLQADLSGVQAWFLAQQASTSVELRWSYVPEPGKRGAQLVTIRREPAGGIFITMDSDTVADSRAIEEGLKPFADARVSSVASVILAYNSTAKLVRLTDAWLLTFQLAVRAAMSRLGCVLVNSGNFSLYRVDNLKEAADSYEAEFFRGNKVEFSDDSLLTLFSHLKGKTIQQPTSFAFTVLPESISHHVRQQLRWMRGSTIRSIWRFRYLPVDGFAYWEHFMSWLNFGLVSTAFVYLLIWSPIMGYGVAPLMALFAVLVAYMTSLRYLTIRRSDQSFRSQLLSWLLAPLMLLWTACVLRPLRFYAIATCWKTGWGTRGKVEVELENNLVEVTA